ncbi:n-alpha-acetyltransferase 50 [Anaeramoeba ignava]|uniref:N-alpha-acetyltransferase 50 n=1 Tax=Anaeramoeba ignava TaxID=1746090 RepID=A0A9Q0LTY8_ANAIG|nr:n-alpha-acetyltransferase 50 [Anaeramoeba ignava]
MTTLAKKFISYGELNDKNIAQLEKLNSVVLPVKYSSQFYKNILSDANCFLDIAFYCKDMVVGGICYRKEKSNTSNSANPKKRLYIMTLSVLENYRRLGIGSHFLEKVISAAQDDASIEDVYLHVHVDNDLAISFYKNFGFEVKERIDGYYKDVNPPDCFILSKVIERK